MNSDTEPSDWQSPALNYIGLCGGALVVTCLVMLNQGYSPIMCLVVLAAGVLGVLTRVGLAPVMLVVVVAVGQLMQQMHWSGGFAQRWLIETRGRLGAGDILLAAAVLAYAIGHYRLQGLSRHIFPPDVRLRVLHRYTRSARRDGVAPTIERKRAVHLVKPFELLLVLSLPLWALLAYLGWYGLTQTRDVLARQHHYEEWEAWKVHLVVLVTVLILVVLLAAAVLRYMRLRCMTRQEARLVMLDTLWNETRGEQRWFARWLTWFKLDRQRRKEQP
jgi:hypothetical protein